MSSSPSSLLLSTETPQSILNESFPTNLKELQEKYQSILDFKGLTLVIIEEIGNEMIRLTTEKQKKSINTLNKQFQNSIMNYFMECYVSELLLNEYNAEFKRDVFKSVLAKMEKNEGTNLKKRYITIINYYLEDIEKNNKIGAYVELLLNIVKEKITAEKDTIDYQTQYRKKLTALLVLEHSLHSDRKTKFTDFYSLWTQVFTFCPLSRKKSNSVRLYKQQKDEFSSSNLNQKRYSNTQDIPINSKRKNTSISLPSPTTISLECIDELKEHNNKSVSSFNDFKAINHSSSNQNNNQQTNLPQSSLLKPINQSESVIISNLSQPPLISQVPLVNQQPQIIFVSQNNQQISFLQQQQQLMMMQNQQSQQIQFNQSQQQQYFNQLAAYQANQNMQNNLIFSKNQVSTNGLQFCQPNQIFILDQTTPFFHNQQSFSSPVSNII